MDTADWVRAAAIAKFFCRTLMGGTEAAGLAGADDADDLAQDTLARVHRYPFDPSRGKTLANYVSKQAVFAASNRFRRVTAKFRVNAVGGAVVPDIRLDADPAHRENPALAVDDPGYAAVDADVDIRVEIRVRGGDVVDAVCGARDAVAVAAIADHVAMMSPRAVVFVLGVAADSRRWRLTGVDNGFHVWEHS